MVLIPEIPGVHPGVLALGNYLVDNGFTVAIPSLFGTPEAPSMTPAMVPVLARACVARSSPRSRRTRIGRCRITCERWRGT